MDEAALNELADIDQGAGVIQPILRVNWPMAATKLLPENALESSANCKGWVWFQCMVRKVKIMRHWQWR